VTRAPVPPSARDSRSASAGRSGGLPAAPGSLAVGSSLDLRSPLRVLAGVGPRIAAQLAAAGVGSVGDLLWLLPRTYEDRRAAVAVASVREGEAVLLRGRLNGVRVRRAGRRVLVEATLADPSGTLAVTWFGQPWLAEKLEAVAGVEVVLHGRVQSVRGRKVLSHPEWAPAGPEGGEGIVPVYTELAGIGSARIRGWVGEALARLDLERFLPDDVPAALRERHGLPPLAAALRQLHQPTPEMDHGQLCEGETPAHHRLVYGELLPLQVELATRAAEQRRRAKPHRYRIDDAVRERAREALPFKLTAAQKRVVRELVGELGGQAPMRRLLQGDVGSGKTVVAALLMLIAAESGLQAAFLAPTELLAEQHFATLNRLLGPRLPVALLAGGRGSDVERRALARGDLPLVVGTQALLEERVQFRRLALVVIDEQHRFGVRQRELLEEKGEVPDLLVMSATPIPRSLALSIYGDLDVSLLDELPPGRQPVATRLVPASARREVYSALRRELEAGGQAYVVFPAIGEPGDEAGEPSLHGLGERLRQTFSDVPTATLHGQLPAAERATVMEAFRRGEVRLLLATTVIEVGVDVPTANAMVIEGAERFGLAQLHQLRGRVGRGSAPAWCAAVQAARTADGGQRLEAFARLADGFALAEEDLRLRGPGELLGERQAGMPGLRFARLPHDHRWLLAAWRDAREMVAAGSPAPATAGPVEPGTATRQRRGGER
jgi:ATP-dependent DNA helicase RecG